MPSERDSGQRRAAAARDLARAGGRDARIELFEYDEAWPAHFAAEAARLADGGFADQLAEQFDLEPQAAIEHLVNDVRGLSLGKLGSPADVARVIAFLLSPPAPRSRARSTPSTAAHCARSRWRRGQLARAPMCTV